jgi:hypothetical protein
MRKLALEELMRIASVCFADEAGVTVGVSLLQSIGISQSSSPTKADSQTKNVVLSVRRYDDQFTLKLAGRIGNKPCISTVNF